MMVFHSRRALMALVELIGLIIGVAIVFVIVALITGLINMFSGEPDSGTASQYQQMLEAVETMYHPSNTNDSCIIPVGYIEPDFAIVGFNRLDQVNAKGGYFPRGHEHAGFITEHCGFDNDIYRPSSCFGDSACLCLCFGGTGDVTGDDCTGGTCSSLSDDVERLLTYKDKSLVDLVLYGESCWLGQNNDVIAAYVLEKEGNALKVIPVYDEAVLESRYSSVPNCDLVRSSLGIDLPKTNQSVSKGDAITEDLDAAKNAGISGNR